MCRRLRVLLLQVINSRPPSALDEPGIHKRKGSVVPLSTISAGIVKMTLPFGDTVTCLAICEDPENAEESLNEVSVSTASTSMASSSVSASPRSPRSPTYFAAGSINKHVRLYDLRTGHLRRTFITSSPVACIAMSKLHGRTKLVVGTFNGRILCFDAEKVDGSPDLDIPTYSGEGAGSLSAIAVSNALTPASRPNEGELLAVGGEVHEVRAALPDLDRRMRQRAGCTLLLACAPHVARRRRSR